MYTRFSMQDGKAPSHADMRAALDRDGVFVVENVVGPELLEKCKSGCFAALEDVSLGNFKSDDRTTWRNGLVPPNTRGQISSFGLGNQEFFVKARMATKCVFEAFWDTPNLWTSFDALSFQPRLQKFAFKSVDEWAKKYGTNSSETIHVDQTTQGFLSLQSGLALSDQDEDNRVFVCQPGSHKFHREILQERQKAYVAEAAHLKLKLDAAKVDSDLDSKQVEKIRLAWVKASNGAKKLEDNSHWLMMTPEMLAHTAHLPRVRVPLKAGSMVFWDSRTLHYNAAPCATMDKDAYRLQLFISMSPVASDEKILDEQIAKRRKLWSDGRTTKHSADLVRSFGKGFNDRGGAFPYKPRTLSPFKGMTRSEKCLHGLKKYKQ